MSSRLSTKPSRKDRPRSSDKLKAGRKRDGTPEKPVSPNQSQSQTEEDVIPASKQVLDGADIKALAIDRQELAKVRVPRPPMSLHNKEISAQVTVRKLKPQGESNTPQMKHVLIAKPAPPNASLKTDDNTGCNGPRYDSTGKIIPHSILGSVEDFKHESSKHGHFKAERNTSPIRPKTSSLNQERTNLEIGPKPRDPFLDENKALINWQLKMMERKQQQGYISKLLKKPTSFLVMNQADNYRKTQEDRYLIERSIPAMDYGRGYRIGSEFWKQQERIGDDLSGIHMTLGETEKGYPPPIENIGVPTAIKEEMGVQLDSLRPRTTFNYPWHQSTFLKERRQQLNEILVNLDPFSPELANLQIIGRNKPTEYHKDDWPIKDTTSTEAVQANEDISSTESTGITVEDIVGPSLMFNHFLASWTGDSHSCKGLVAHGARVTFEVCAGERITSFLNLTNKGNTTIYYDWKKVPKINPFQGCASPKLQRFYFNTSNGVLLPGESLEFPFVFKSPNAGIFFETWQLDTRPVLCGGAALQVTLRGIALQEDKHKKLRLQIEQDLFDKQAKLTASRILDELLAGIKTPERPSSPVDAYITQEEIFQQNNWGMHYSSEIVSHLSHVYLEQFDEDSPANCSWDLSIFNMKKEFLSHGDETKREDLLTKMNSAVTHLYFPPCTPIRQQLYRVGYQLLIETIDNIVTQSSIIRENLGISTKVVEIPDTDQILGAYENLRGGEIKKKKKDHKEDDVKKDNKKDNKKGKKEEKEKDRPKSKGGKTKSRTATSPPATREHRKANERKQMPTPIRSLTPPMETDDPIINCKYRSKMYLQVYDLLSKTIDKMIDIFDDIQNKGQ